jgi:hypothetical protein
MNAQSIEKRIEAIEQEQRAARLLSCPRCEGRELVEWSIEGEPDSSKPKPPCKFPDECTARVIRVVVVKTHEEARRLMSNERRRVN